MQVPRLRSNSPRRKRREGPKRKPKRQVSELKTTLWSRSISYRRKHSTKARGRIVSGPSVLSTPSGQIDRAIAREEPSRSISRSLTEDGEKPTLYVAYMIHQHAVERRAVPFLQEVMVDYLMKTQVDLDLWRMLFGFRCLVVPDTRRSGSRSPPHGGNI